MRLVEQFDEERAVEVLGLRSARYAPAEERPLPAFVGTGHGGHGDLGRRAKAIVRAELGDAGPAR